VSSAERFVRHQQHQTDRALSAAFARLTPDAGSTATFADLLGIVRRRAPRLLEGPAERGRHPGIEALEQLARAADRYLRAPAAWPGSGASWHGVVHDLSRHLLARYPIPAFLGAAWYAADPHAEAQRRWFVEHGRGQPFRALDLPVAMTRRMEHVFLKSPPHLTVPHALRRAELLALGATPELAATILATPAALRLEHGEFWRTAWRFLIAHAGALADQVAPLIDFLDGVRHEHVVVETAAGPERRAPHEPQFSRKGRTVAAVVRLMHDWHRSLGRAAGAARWTPSPLAPMRVEYAAEDPRLPPVEWLLVELTSAAELRAEGAALGHCVAIYSRRCTTGDARIWSLRRKRGDSGPRPVLTIEIDLRRQAIVQARAYRNRLPEGRPLPIVRSWAAREGLLILRLYGGASTRYLPRCWRKNASIAGQACSDAFMLAPSWPVCWRRKPWPAPS
jgi:hypothetical protein